MGSRKMSVSRWEQGQYKVNIKKTNDKNGS